MHSPPQERALTKAVMLGWAAGSGGTVTLLYLVNLFLLYFMTDVVGIGAALAGVLIFVARIYDMLSDPIVGLLSDRTRSAWGRRRPWMLAGALLSALSCALIFAPPGQLIGSGGAQVYLVCALMLYFTGYTCFNVPYLAMPAEITPHYHERTSLMSYRVLFVSIAGLVATAFAPWLLDVLGGGRTGFARMGLVMAALILLAMLVTVYTTSGVRFTEHRSSTLPLRVWWQTIGQNRPFLLLIAVKLLQLFALACTSATLIFFVKYALGRSESAVGLYGLVLSVASIASLPVWVRVAKKRPKHRVLMLATLAQATFTLSWLFASTDEATWLFALRAAALGISSAGVILMGQALLPDVIEYDFHRTGQRREGMFAALYSFVEKTSFAFAPLIIGPMLAYMGYVAGAIEQTPSALRALYIAIALLPCAAYLASIPLLAVYDLTEAKLKHASDGDA